MPAGFEPNTRAIQQRVSCAPDSSLTNCFLCNITTLKVELLYLLINQVLTSPRLAIVRRCDALLANLLDALVALTPLPLTEVTELVNACSQAVQGLPAAQCPLLSSAFVRAGHPTMAAPATTRVTSIEALMAVPYEQWHQAYVIGACGKSGRKGRSDYAVCKVLVFLRSESFGTQGSTRVI
jgi:hypothetical protein